MFEMKKEFVCPETIVRVQSLSVSGAARRVALLSVRLRFPHASGQRPIPSPLRSAHVTQLDGCAQSGDVLLAIGQ